DNGHLSHEIAGAEDRQQGLIWSTEMLDHLNPSRINNEHAVTGFAFPDNDFLWLVDAFLHRLRNIQQRRGINTGKYRDTFQKTLAFRGSHMQDRFLGDGSGRVNGSRVAAWLENGNHRLAFYSAPCFACFPNPPGDII